MKTTLTLLKPPGPPYTLYSFGSLRKDLFLLSPTKAPEPGRSFPVLDRFQGFLRKNLGDSRAFVNSIGSRVKRDSQYQHKKVQDWASHLEHLQAILIEFDTDGAPEKSDLIHFLRKEHNPLVKLRWDNVGKGWITGMDWSRDGLTLATRQIPHSHHHDQVSGPGQQHLGPTRKALLLLRKDPGSRFEAALVPILDSLTFFAIQNRGRDLR